MGDRGLHGWFKPGERSYAPLLKSAAVDLLAKSYPPTAMPGQLYLFKYFLELNKVGPEELLGWGDVEIKQAVRRACLQKNSEEKFASARRVFYVVNRFLELNNKAVTFNRSERRQLFKRRAKKISRQHIPTKEEIYRMADSFPNKGLRQKARGKAIILCLWQSGVRASCLCSWLYGMFKDQLYPEIQVPVRIKVVAYRQKGVTNCGVDTKLSAYNVSYYYTFLHREGAEALRSYIGERRADGWQPEDSSPIFVTEGTASINKPLTGQHLVEIVKNAAKQIGIKPDTVWTHCLRKAFRKTLYRSGLDPDVAEALMGHKLAASRGSYFDYHDESFAAEQYKRGSWGRITADTVMRHSEKIAELERKNAELKQRLNGWSMESSEMRELMKRIEKLEKQAQKQG